MFNLGIKVKPRERTGRISGLYREAIRLNALLKNSRIKNKIVYMTQKIYYENLTPEQRRFVIMQRFGNDYKNARITYQQDPVFKMCVSHKRNQFSKFNFVSRAKFIGEFDSDSVLPYLLHLTKVCEYRFLKPYHKRPVNQLRILYSKWIEPNNSFPFHEFEFECDSNIPDKTTKYSKTKK